jgi:hypothetical protein
MAGEAQGDAEHSWSPWNRFTVRARRRGLGEAVLGGSRTIITQLQRHPVVQINGVSGRPGNPQQTLPASSSVDTGFNLLPRYPHQPR